MQLLISLISGVLFGLGLSISGMLNPQKVQGFLDIAGAWDPSLAFVMGGGLMVNLAGILLMKKRGTPFLAQGFHMPTSTLIDKRLVLGAVLFGAGWALAGLCPGPAIASLAMLTPDIGLFFLCMVAGLLVAQRV
ncbi:MAG: DUF6691 family protein [Parvibaculales bacterium]